MSMNYTAVALSLVMIVLLGVGFVSAYQFGNGFMNSNLSDEEKADRYVQREAIRSAVDNQDFETWKSLMQGKLEQMQERLTEENFNNLVQRHQERAEFRQAMDDAREAGATREEMQQLREEYGIGAGNGFGKGLKKGFEMRSGNGQGNARGRGAGSGNCPLAE